MWSMALISPERLIEYDVPLTPEEAEEVRRGFILLGETFSYMSKSKFLLTELFCGAPTALVHQARELVEETFIL